MHKTIRVPRSVNWWGIYFWLLLAALFASTIAPNLLGCKP
jgi:hypothetical protein